MTTVFNFTLKTVFWLALVFIAITIYTLTFGKYSSYEFADWRLASSFYDVLMQGLPLAILLTLTGTVKRTNEKSKNFFFVIATVLGAIISFFIMVSMIFSLGFVAVINEKTLYRNKFDPSTTITEQRIGYGALGTDGHRIVKLKPLLNIWNRASSIDTSQINRSDWTFVNQENSN